MWEILRGSDPQVSFLSELAANLQAIEFGKHMWYIQD